MSYVHPAYEVGGSDISHWQVPVNWNVFTPKVNFIILRLGDGLGPDVDFPEFWAAAKAMGLDRGSYHYLRPGLNPGQQAQMVISMLEQDWGELDTFSDIEAHDNQSPRTVTNAFLSYSQAVEAHSLLPRPLTGIYSSPGFWNEYIEHDRIPQLAQRTLWMAQYFRCEFPAHPTWIPDGWPRWDLWQWSCTGHRPYGQPGDGKDWGVFSKGLDLDVWRGTQAEYDAWFAHADQPPGPPPEPPDPGQRKFRTKDLVRARTAPDETNGKILGLLPVRFGPVPILDTHIDRLGREWWCWARGNGVEAWTASWHCYLV